MGTTINAANISIGLDVRKLKEGGGFARGEISKISSLVRQSVSPVEQYNQQLNLLEKALSSGAITSDRFAAAQETIAKKYGVVTPLMKAHNDETEKATRLAAERAAKEKQLAEEQIASAKRLAEARAAAERRHDSALRESLALRRSVMTAQEKHNEVTQRYKVMLDQGRISHQTYYRLLAQEESALRRATQATKDHTNAIAKKNATEKSGGGGTSLLGSVSRFAPQLALGMAVKTSLELASAVETASAAFEVLTGSASSANKMVSDMKQLDRNSPLNFMDIQQAGKTLLGYGMTAEKIMPTLTALSQVSMGNAEKMKLMALAVGQVNTLGRLQGTELRQLTEHGFNPLEYIAKRTGQTMAQVIESMGEGAISAELFNQALQDATSEGGRFFGMNEKISKTGAGQYAKLISDLQEVGVVLGTSVMPAAKEFVGFLRQGVQEGGNLKSFFDLVGTSYSMIFATMSGDLGRYLDESKAAAEQLRIDGVIRDIAKEQEIVNQKLAIANKFWERINGTSMSQVESMKKMQTIAQEFAAIREATERAAGQTQREEALESYARIEEEYKRRMIGAEKFERWKIANSMMGAKMTEGDKVAQQNALEKFDYLERAKRAEEERKKLEENFKKRLEEAERIKEANKQVAQSYIEASEGAEASALKKLAEINKLQNEGFLTAAQASAARTSQLSDFEKSRDNGVSATIAPALKAGSAEAYKFLIDRQKDPVQERDRKEMLKKAEQQVQLLGQIAARPMIEAIRN